jgi:hypothetical protein
LLWREKMAKRSKKTQKSQVKPRNLVIVAFAEDLEEAKDYEALLKNNYIPAIIKEQDGESANTKCFAVMVPEDFLDEAHVVIESQDAYDDFYDTALESEDDTDFNNNFFEDDF